MPAERSCPAGTWLTVGGGVVHQACFAARVSPSSPFVVVVLVDVASGGGAGSGCVKLIARVVTEAVTVVIRIGRGDVATRVAALMCERRTLVAAVLPC